MPFLRPPGRRRGTPGREPGQAPESEQNIAPAPAQEAQWTSEPQTTGRIDGWMNLQDYVGLNRDQGERMAQDVTGDVARRSETAKSRLDAARQGFERRADEGVVAGVPGAGVGSMSSAEAAARAGSYSGPSEFSDQGVSADLARAAGDVSLAQTNAGRRVLAGQHYGQGVGGAYGGSRGQAADELLMGGSGAWNELASRYGGIGGAYEQAKKGMGARAAQNRALSDVRSRNWMDLAESLAEKEKIAAYREKWNKSVVARRDSRTTAGGVSEEVTPIDDERWAALQHYGVYGTWAKWAAAGKPPLGRNGYPETDPRGQ